MAAAPSTAPWRARCTSSTPRPTWPSTPCPAARMRPTCRCRSTPTRCPLRAPNRGRPWSWWSRAGRASRASSASSTAAGQIVRAVGDRARVVGLDWGPAAGEAAAAGVHLVPTRAHGAFLRLVAGATVVLGQSGGILSASELEAIGIGVPVVVPVPLPLYADASPPVLGDSPETAAEAVLSLLDGSAAAGPGPGPGLGPPAPLPRGRGRHRCPASTTGWPRPTGGRPRHEGAELMKVLS